MTLTAKQEAFAQAVVSGMTQADAFRTAYNAGGMTDKTIREKASRLMANEHISARVESLRKPLQAMAEAKLAYGLEQAMREAMEAYNVALEKGNGGAMVAAATLRAKLNGLLIDRKEVRTGTLEAATDVQLDSIIQAKAREAGVSLH